MSRDSQEGAEGWEAGRAWSAIAPVGADSREVGPDEAPTVSKAAALLQAAPAAPEIRQFPGVVCGEHTWIPMQYEDGWDVLSEDGLSFFDQTYLREMADELEAAEAEAMAAGDPWNDPNVAQGYRLLADLMDQITAGVWNVEAG